MSRQYSALCMFAVLLIPVVTMLMHRHGARYRYHSTGNVQDISRQTVINRLHQPNEHFHFHLLSLDRLDEAVHLLVSCHFKSSLTLLGYSSVPRLLSGMVESIDTLMRRALVKDVTHGFNARLPKRLQQPSYALTSESLVVIATEQNSSHIVGLVEIYPEEVTYVCNLAVSPTVRRRGLARSLCLVCEQIAFGVWGRRQISLMVERSNAAAINLYESLNYTMVAETHNIPCEEYLLGMRHLLTYTKNLTADGVS